MHEDDGLHPVENSRHRMTPWQLPVLRKSIFDGVVVAITGIAAGFFALTAGDAFSVAQLSSLSGQYEVNEPLAAMMAFGLSLAYFGLRRLTDLYDQVSQRISAQELSHRLIVHDGLTGLYNRAHFLDQIALSIARTKRTNGFLAIVVVNIKKFNLVNDGYSRGVGDRLLIEFSRQLQSSVRSNERLARLDGDNFGIIVEFNRGDSMESVKTALNRIVASLKRPLTVDDMSIDLDVNVGASLYPFDALDAQTLLRYANMSMRRGKSDRSATPSLFDRSTDESFRERAELELELKSAVQSGAITPVYQPLIDLQHGTLSGYEILARWNHPERGTIAPSKFIPIAESSGVITDITLSVLETACRDWSAHELQARLAINVSPLDFRDPWFPERLLAVLAKTGFPPALLEIEITENSIVDDAAAAHQAIQSLRNQGVRVALDDFGAGYSNLSQLSNLCIDKIKIDRYFISSMLQDSTNMAVVKTIIGLANVMEVAVLAEGIETWEQADTLRGIGCDFGQGHWFAKPAAAHEVKSVPLPKFADLQWSETDVGGPENLDDEVEPAVDEDLSGPDVIVELSEREGRLAQLGRLCATVAHQLRNPLGSIRNAAYVIKRNVPNGDEHFNMPLQRIDSAVGRCDRLISQLLDFARTNTLELQSESLDTWLELIVRDQADGLPDVIGLRLELALGSQEVVFDPHKLQCVVNNLIANASEALVGKGETPEDLFCPDPVIVIKTRLSERGVEIAVANNGPAIPKDDVKRILEPLYTTKSFGTGLGLPLVADHLRLHGGGLDIESEEGSGVTFTAWFPLRTGSRPVPDQIEPDTAVA